MKSIIQRLWMFIVVLCVSISASAYDFKVDGLYYNILSEEELKVEVTYEYELSQNANYVSGHLDITQEVVYNSKTYSVISIGELAFYGCLNLTSVTLPNSVTSIVEDAFSECTGLTSVDIPNSVTSIGDYAFFHCSSLISVTIPNSVTSIGYDTFYKCTSLTSVEIPNSVTSIGKNAFYGCSSLSSVTIPNSMTSIGESAFHSCSSLTSVTIPNSVTSIGNSSFYGCSLLVTVSIPSSVTYFGHASFNKSNNLRTIYVEWENPLTCTPMFSDEVYNEAILYVPVGTKAEYEKVEPWKYFKNIRELEFSGVDTINPDNNDSIRVSVNNGILTIEGIDARENISICDMQGRIVFHGASRTVDNLPSGLYLVKAGSKSIKVSL